MSEGDQLPGKGSADTARRVDAVAWGLFFVWVGIALVADIGWGLGLFGIGLITLGAQVARRSCALGFEGFWLAVGILFVLGGVWEMFGVDFSLTPVVLIIAGGALLLSAMRKSRA